MERKLRIAQYGCGKMSVYTMRYAMEKGAEIVCAFGRSPHNLGKDIGDIAGVGKTGVLVQDSKDAAATLKEKKPDACIITTASLMQDLKGPLMDCAESGVNAITIGEEAFYPWNSSSQTTQLLDDVAKRNGCTLCGSGYQDVLWGNLITTLAGATHTIKKITGKSSYNVEDYGLALAKVHGAGLSVADFEKEIAAADTISDAERKALIAQEAFLPSYMWNVNGWLCARLGLTVKKQTQRCVPQIHDNELRSETLQMTIPAGHATGMSAVVTTITEEGIVIEAECIGKVYAAGEFDQNVWTIQGEPNTEVIINRPATVELTCATIVNRIPDLIAAAPGFTTTEQDADQCLPRQGSQFLRETVRTRQTLKADSFSLEASPRSRRLNHGHASRNRAVLTIVCSRIFELHGDEIGCARPVADRNPVKRFVQSSCRWTIPGRRKQTLPGPARGDLVGDNANAVAALLRTVRVGERHGA